MVIGLNAGHTLKGAGFGAQGVLVESVETRRVVEEMSKLLKTCGCKIVPCTIDAAATQKAYLEQVVQLANRQDLDWFISIHFNSAKSGGNGVEVYTYQGRQYADAVEVCNYIAAQGFKNRGVKSGSGLYVINKTKAKAMLIEVCFVQNPDAAVYKQMFKQICQAIAYALADYVQAAPAPAVPEKVPEKQRYVKVIVNELTVRKSLAWEGNAAGVVHNREVFTIAEGPIKVGSGSMYKLKSGLYITASSKYVQVITK